jgi:hypothetical protein
MKVTFSLRTRERRDVPEDAWPAELDALLNRRAVDPDYLAGKITLEAAGQADVVVSDDLPPLVQNLCLLGPKSLLAGSDFHFGYWGQEGEVRMALEGGDVRIEGDYIPSARYPARALIEALVGCARRALDLFTAVHQKREPAPQADSPAHLEALYREVEALLQAAPGDG